MSDRAAPESPLRLAVAYFRYLKEIGIEYVENAPAGSRSSAGTARDAVDAGEGAGVCSSETDEMKKKASAAESLKELSEAVSACHACGLHGTRTQTVFGSGNPKAGIIFVGEAPGAEEDRQGLPFVGRAGQLLTKMIENTIECKREDVFIANVLKCRPPGNRDPLPDEVAACEHFLVRQIELIKPGLICALGAHAARTLLKSEETIGRLRGRWHDYHGVPLIPTYHPAFLLRNDSYKKAAWEDLKMLRDEHRRITAHK